MKDQLFKNGTHFNLEGFVFDARVTQVFDDMVSRSVPGYATIQLLVADLANRFENGAPIYDLGCSTGNTLMAIIKRAKTKGLKLVGMDSSPDMLKLCRSKLKDISNDHSLILENRDITGLKELPYGKAGVIILNLVLQFIRPLHRKKILSFLHDNLLPGGCLILVEKTIQENEFFNNLFISYYHEYKKEMGYTDMEISNKREALENKLIPFYSTENLNAFKESGFETVTTFFQWMNFQGYIGVKSPS